MRRSIFKAGSVTVFGLLIAFAIVSANSNTRHAATTAAKADNAVATAPAPADECTSSDVCCAKETKAVVAAAPKKATKKAAPAVSGPGAAGMVIAIDPETGELGMPNADQMRELRGTQQTQAKAPATVLQTANGGLVSPVELDPEFATIHIDANGKKVFGHSDNPTPNPAPATPALEEK